MCLGAQAKAQNEAARRQYNYELQRRERNWFQQLSVTNAQHVKYEEDVANAGLAQAQAYADKCLFIHNADRTNEQEDRMSQALWDQTRAFYVGENLYISS